MNNRSAVTRALSWGEPSVKLEQASEAEFVLPSGTVTLLLADIEGSVRLWEAEAEAMPAAIARHDELTPEIVRRHEGVLPRDQGEGDGFVAAFSRPSEALSCAIALQRAHTKEEWGLTPIKLRIALHTGEVQLCDGGNYIGHAVNRCARIRDIAHGGQTLVSRSTFDLVVDRPPDGVTFIDLGTHRLRDLARPEHVHQVAHPDLPNTFPPLRSLDTLPNNLPVQLTSFVGRAEEIGTLRELLRNERLLTLTGSGGCGKTRLALQVAADALEDFPDGVWVADLSVITDPAVVPKAVGSVLRLREQPGRGMTETIVAYLQGTRCLVLLDNCEHVVAACAELADAVLKACSGLTIVATSREPLGVPGETPWRVPCLSLPDEKDSPRIEALTQYDAVNLFVERALKSRPNFGVTNDNAGAVAQICHRLDGIPLAIELAAARVRLLTPERIAAGLDDRFRLLTGSSRIVVPRQQTLAASVDWSYDLLSEPEQTVFRRLSVFAGGFTLDAAEHVCASEEVEAYEVLDLLSRLVDKSLVVTDDDGSGGRYSMLHTLRQYATDRLAASNEEASVRTRHRDHYLAFAQTVFEEMYGRDMDAWFRTVEVERDNLEAALRWSTERDDVEALLRLCEAVLFYWAGRFHLQEGRKWLGEALSRSEGFGSSARSSMLVGSAFIEAAAGNLGVAPSRAQEALTAAREAGNNMNAAVSLDLLAGLAWTFGDRATASRYFEEAAALARETVARAAQSDPDGIQAATGRALWCLALVLSSQGNRLAMSKDFAQAPVVLEEAIAVAGRSGAHTNIRYSLVSLGWAHFHRGELKRAERVLGEAASSARDAGDAAMLATALGYLAIVLQFRGDYEGARARYNEASALVRFAQLDAPFDVPTSWSSWYLAFLLPLAEADTATARAGVDELRSEVDSVPGMRHYTLWWLAVADLAEGDPESARRRWLELSDDTFPPENLEWVHGGNLRVEALLARAEGDGTRAEDRAHDALANCRALGATGSIPYILETLAALALDAQSFEESARLFGAAQSSFDALGVARWKLYQTAYESDVAAVREALGSQDFEAAWGQGAAMSTDEAVAYVQRGRGKRKRPTKGWGSLTPVELEVTKLITQGLRNAQIAERMFVSLNTVESHLKHVYAKLGISSRTELALEATRRGFIAEEK